MNRAMRDVNGRAGNLSAVLFDLDGTLLDTLEDLGNAANRALEKGGFPAHPIEAYRRFVGDGVFKLMERALPPGKRDPRSIARMVEVFRAEYRRSWKGCTRLYPGVEALLDALVDRQVPFGVLSNKPHEFTLRCVEEFLGGWPFAVVLGQQEGLPRKPDPAGAREVAHRMGLEPRMFAYVGDSDVDMETARAAGMIPLGALWGFRSADELTLSGAVDLLERPGDLLRYF